MAGLDSYVKLYCNFNGADGSTSILDDYGGKTITANGNAQLDTAQKKFGTASLLLDGNGDFLSVADSEDFNFGSGDFTIDCQVRFNVIPSATDFACIFSQRATNTSNHSCSLSLYNDYSTHKLYFSFTHDGTTVKNMIVNNQFSTGQWYHIEVCREGSWIGLFVDGTHKGCYYVGSNSLYNSTAEFKIGGSNSTTANYLNGWVDEFRLSKGIARHTLVNYTPSTAGYTADANDVLLLHMDGSNNSTTFTDSATSKTVTVNGNSKIKTTYDYGLAPKFGTGMAWLDGDADYLTVPDSEDWNFGSGDFTIDFWVNFIAMPGSYTTFLSHTGGTSYLQLYIVPNGGNYDLALYDNANIIVKSSSAFGALSTGTWYHIAYTRSGNTWGIFINGTSLGTTTATNTINNHTSTLYIGCYSGSQQFVNAYFDEFRISKGIARWTSSFTPSTSAYASDADTKLLLHCDGTQASTTFTDSGNTGHTVTANGNAKINVGTETGTINPKVGTAMGYFDGVGDYLSLADSTDWNMGSGDWTIDCWINLTNITGYKGIVSQRYSDNIGHSLTFQVSTDSLYFLCGTAPSTNTGGEFAINLAAKTWYHVALVRDGATVRSFVDGRLDTTTYNVGTSTIQDSAYPLLVAGIQDGAVGNTFDGNIDELRVSKGIARFSIDCNFTAPTSQYSGVSVTTGTATNVTQSQFDITGIVTSETDVTERGFVYAITANPTTANNKKILAGSTGAMETTITGLSPITTYYIRAYATVDSITYYGDDVEVTTTPRQGVLLEILEYQSTETAEATTSTSQIKITAHGLSTHDMIVNTSCRTQDAERGARLVGATGLTADIIPLDDVISTQTAGDSVRLYKYIDRTDLVRIKSFRMTRRTGGKTEASFVLVTDANYIPRSGQYVRINWNVGESSVRKFLGIIKSVRMVAASEAYGMDKLFLTVSCVGLNQVPSRRTISVSYAEGTSYGSIVEEMVDKYLYQDGIRKSTIDTGELLADEWMADVVSISEVLDECASKSGYQWFINDEGLLNFYADPASIPTATEDIVDAGTFTDFSNLEFEESLDNYMNKMFIAGGRDTLNDNEIIIGSEDFSESTAMQNITAGTGVYGTVQRDAGLVESNWVTAENGTTTTNVEVTAHGQETGYMVYNSTRQAYRQITKVDANNFSVAEVTDQAENDDIVFFDQANKLIANEFKIRGFMPKKFSFVTREMGFEPGSKIQVDLARYGISTEYYVIDDVEIYDEGGTVQTFRCRVSCSLRDNSNFTTQRLPNFYNYFGGF